MKVDAERWLQTAGQNVGDFQRRVRSRNNVRTSESALLDGVLGQTCRHSKGLR